jgi:ABC-2 type transport system ATP-binding protein
VTGPGILARLTGVTKRFHGGPPALDAVSASLPAGRITGLVGPDGAGKTTLLRLMTGLLEAEEGEIEVLGFDARTQAASIQASIGYMPQRFGLYEDLSVAENLDLYADLRALPRTERAAVFGELLDFTGLGPFTSRLAGRLSGGMKQKLGLACALLRKPRLLLLDEPGVGVDPISRRELWRMVEGLAAEGVGVLWSTAYLDEAQRCDRILLLNGGRLLFDGPPRELAARVEGRVFRLEGAGAGRRDLLARLLAQGGIVDGVIQGRAIRLVAGEGREAPSLPPGAGPAARLVPAAPRLEDAFIDALAGRTGAASGGPEVRSGAGGQSALARSVRAPGGGTGPAIEARGLTKRFGGFTAADGISFEIARGEIFGLLGPNGAGKSTVFKMLCGLLRPSAGEGFVAGHDLRRDTANARGRLGYMAQKFSLYGDLSVAQNLAFFAGVYGLSGARRRRQTALMTEIFDLGPRLGTSAKDLPLGFKQRLALACAVMHEPEILFLDEPTSGVDPVTRREFWAHVNALAGNGVTTLVTTHFMDEAEYCDRICLIHDGRAIALGTPDDLKAGIATPSAPDPTLEDAFVALVEASRARRRAA